MIKIFSITSVQNEFQIKLLAVIDRISIFHEITINSHTKIIIFKIIIAILQTNCVFPINFVAVAWKECASSILPIHSEPYQEYTFFFFNFASCEPLKAIHTLCNLQCLKIIICDFRETSAESSSVLSRAAALTRHISLIAFGTVLYTSVSSRSKIAVCTTKVEGETYLLKMGGITMCGNELQTV